MESGNREIFKAAFPGKYIQGENAIDQLPDLISLLGSSPITIASPTVTRDILPKITLPANNVYSGFGGECCESELQRISNVIETNNADIVIGMGGGKVIDAAKIVADRAGLPVIIIPTIASSDAPCSGCAVIYSEDGKFESVYYQKMNPEVVLVDSKVIAMAPVRFLLAGMGDALATCFEASSCNRSKSANECGGYSTLAAMNLAGLCYDILLEYGSAAKTACENNFVTPALEHVIEANILLSGIGFESSGLAAAHSIHNGLTAIPETRDYYHGEKVAFGTLTGLHLNDAPIEEIEEVYSFCEELGLPTTFAEIGINSDKMALLPDSAKKACEPQESIHKEAGIITPDKVLNALIAADAYGRNRKNRLIF